MRSPTRSSRTSSKAASTGWPKPATCGPPAGLHPHPRRTDQRLRRARRRDRGQRRATAQRPDRRRVCRGAGPRTRPPDPAPLRPRHRGTAAHATAGDGSDARRHRRRGRRRRGCGIAAIAGTGGGDPEPVALFPAERAGSRPRRRHQHGSRRLRSALDAEHVRAPGAAVPLRRQAAGVPPHPPGHRIAYRRHP